MPPGLDLLLENRLRDNKAFYEENKPALRQTVIEPFYALIEQLGPAMLRLDPQLIVEPKKCLARLRRDTRFTRDKTMYRDHVWCVFVRDKSGWSSKPCFYFSLNQEDFSYGAGYYQTPPPVMAAFRELVLEGDKDFAPLPEWLERSEFELDGETYRRNRYPQQPERLQPCVNSRSISVRAAQHRLGNCLFPRAGPVFGGQAGAAGAAVPLPVEGGKAGRAEIRERPGRIHSVPAVLLRAKSGDAVSLEQRPGHDLELASRSIVGGSRGKDAAGHRRARGEAASTAGFPIPGTTNRQPARCISS